MALVAVGDDIRLLEQRVADFAAERRCIDLQGVDFLAVGIVDRELSPLLRVILCVPVIGGTE